MVRRSNLDDSNPSCPDSSVHSNMSKNEVIYGLDDRPPIGRAVILAAQHVLTMFGATVAVPLLLQDGLRMQQQDVAILISSVMLCSGLATWIQVTFGSRLPIVQGISFSFLPAFLVIISAVGAGGLESGGSAFGATVMQYIAGAIILGAVFEIAIGFSGLVGWLRRLLSPVVIGPVIMLIGLALFQHGAPKAGTDWPVSGLTIVLVILFSLVLSRYHIIFKLLPILLTLVVVVTLCWVLTLTGVYTENDPSYVNLSAANSSAWLRVYPAELVFPWGMPRFHVGFFVAVLAGYLASMIESYGDYHACSQMAGGEEKLTPQQVSRGIGCEGIGCLLTGMLGGFASTSYSENIGLVGLTKVGSRYVVQIGALMLIVLGVFGKFGALAAAIPGPVVGGLYCALFGLISAVGIQQLAKCDLKSDRNLFIAGFSLFMGLSVPAYFSSVETPGPGETLAVYTPTVDALLSSLYGGIGDIVESIGKTGMAVAAIIGLILDNLIPGSQKERGL